MERTVTLCRPYGERTTVVFVHISADTGLHKVHPTQAGTYILDACVFLFPTINFALIDSDCVPVTLFEIRELWLASTDPTRPATPSKVAKNKLSSPIASSHKRARSVDTGRDLQQPGPPSKLSRSHSADHIVQADTPHDPKGTQSTPQQVAERERQYMELQSIIHQANQQTLTDSRPAKTKQTQQPANLLAASQQSTDNAAAAASSDSAAGDVLKTPAPPQSKPPDKISAQSLFHMRPGPPSAPPASKAHTDTPGTDVLSSDSHSAAHIKDDEQQQPLEQQAAQDDTSTEESSPANSPKESPETQATDAAGASSPEPASESRQDDDLDNADISALQKMEKRACERVASYETRLSNAREQLSRIRKRLKRMSDDRSSDTLQPSPGADIEMEIID